MTRASRWLIIVPMALVLVSADQITKVIAIHTLRGEPPIIFIGDLFRLQFAWNTGAFLSLGSTLPDAWRSLVITGLNVAILAGVLGFLLFKRQINPIFVWALGLILSGGIGNLIDRIIYNGRVADFLNVGIGGLRSGIFNIADLAIVAGLLLVIYAEVRHGREAAKRAREAEQAGDGS